MADIEIPAPEGRKAEKQIGIMIGVIAVALGGVLLTGRAFIPKSQDPAATPSPASQSTAPR